MYRFIISTIDDIYLFFYNKKSSNLDNSKGNENNRLLKYKRRFKQNYLINNQQALLQIII